ncbi:MAG: beta-ketoacyl-ACP synthase II [Elusimicrobia bacterium]|nr:beta-ketoacyl-ACP synthase II [Elusimicrobiota bacterium]
MDKRRVVITGMGAVTSVGNNVQDFWSSLLAGKSGIGKITRYDTAGYDTDIAGEIRDFDPVAFGIEAKKARRVDLFVLFALAAAKEAYETSGLDIDKEDPFRCGVIIGSGIGGLLTVEREHIKLLEKGPKRVSPFLIPAMIVDIAAGEVAIKYNFMGVNYGVVSACASSAHAIGDSFRMIQHGDADIVLSGGAEAATTTLGLSGFCSAKALSTAKNDSPERASRPFDRDRDGFVMSEGAGILVLEELEHAKKRGANILAEIIGYGATADAYHITAPHPEGAGGIQAMKAAIKDARIDPSDIQYINAHGTSTQLNDKAETIVIKEVFGDHASRIMISSTKSMVGHMLGAAGAAELIATIKSINEKVVHPTINYETPDPDCDLDYVPNEPREAEVKAALSNSLGFGGHNASLIVKKFSG